MYNTGDDNELDRLSKEAAGRYEAPGNANWQAMQAELDKVLPEEKTKRRIIFFWWFLPVLLAGGTTWWLLQKQNPVQLTEKNIPAISSNKAANPGTTQKPGSNDIAVAVAQENATEKKAAVKVEADLQTSVTKTAQSTKRLPVQKSGNDVSVQIDAAVTLKSAGKNELNQSSAPANRSTTTPEMAKAIDKQEMIDKPAVSNLKTDTDNTKETSTKINKENPVVTDIPVAKDANPTVPEVAKNLAPSTKTFSPVARGKGWSFSMLVGVDKSTVKFRYSKSPGINIGLLAGYHFNDKWSLHTGAIYTQKNYKLAGEDFTAPKGSWVSYYTIDNVEGYCRMWEVPLVVRYTVSNTAKKSVFLSTGLSSYFMTKEDYTYYFNSNGLPTSRAATYPSTDTHIFSIAHLSIGFENRISNNLSLQIEPYAKIPFAGVGLGDIKISSFGVNFSLQLRQPLKK